MKKTYYILLYVYSWLVLIVILNYLLRLFGYDWTYLLGKIDILRGIIFLFLTVTLSITLLSGVLLQLVQAFQTSRLEHRLEQILKGKAPSPMKRKEMDRNLLAISSRLTHLTEAVQNQENQALQMREEIVEEERRRIARDLHDTVSQELFAANMMLAGLSSQFEGDQDETKAKQLDSISQLLETAQKDLRILMLQLRPRELEGRDLVDSMKTLLAEVEERSAIQVRFEHDVHQLPESIEEHVFRILQEFISNTLRHAQASHLEIYLIQRMHELQFKLVDDGIGFQADQRDKSRYGLRNIEDRVQDMAGDFRLLTAPNQGVSLDIRIPLLQ